MHSKQDLQHIFDDNQIDLALIFQPTFNQDKTLQILLDSSDPNRASTINVYALNILQNSLLDQRNINLTSSPNIIPLTTLLFNPQGKSIYTFVPGLLGMILMIICALMTSISIVREKEQGSMEVLLISPIKPIFVILSKLTPYFLLSCLILAVVLLVCMFLLDLKINGNPLLLFGYCMLYISLALSIGLLVSNLAKTQVVAMLVCALLFLMPIMMLSGMMFPIESMPQILQYLSHIIPTKWFIIGLKKIMIEGLGITYILQELIILTSMLSVVVLLSLKTFKIRL
ncbi:ABC transporter permease [Helicobacter pullorum]|uniref:ABC transporter permease n=1 Tax=Helicobacter pullorum TaxID=35818 RepID=UPI00242D3E54|nr:ABC transporter permease [Helicobacter pullorum]